MKKAKRKLLSVLLMLTLVTVLLPTLFATSASAASYTVYDGGTITPTDYDSYKNMEFTSSKAAYRYTIKPSQSGWYEFRSTAYGDRWAADPFLVITDYGEYTENYLKENGCMNGTTASKTTYVDAYNDDGGEGSHFYTKVYLYADHTYYVYCTRYAVKDNHGYRLQYKKSSDTSYPPIESGTISVGDSLKVIMDGNKVANCYSFTAPCDGTFRVTSSNRTTAPAVDPYVAVSTESAKNATWTRAQQVGGLTDLGLGTADGVVAWNDDAGGTMEFSADFTMTSGQTYYIFCGRRLPGMAMGSYTVNLNRVYWVYYDANGGTSSVSRRGLYSGTDSISFDIPDTITATREGYTFAGWNTKADGTGTTYQPGGSVTNYPVTPTGSDVTLYAKWNPNTYTVTLNNQSATTAGSTSVTATYDAAMPTAIMPTKTGYTFNGYFDAISGGTKYYNADGTSAKTWDKTSSTTLYAQWTVNTYTVTLNANEGTCDALTSYTYGIGATLPVPTKSGFIFGGWYTSSDFSGSAVTAISVTDTGDKVFYAKWSAASELTPELSEGNITLGFTTTASAYKETLEYEEDDMLCFVICDKNGKTVGTSQVKGLDEKTEVKFSVNPAEITKAFSVKLVNETKNKSEDIDTVSMADYCHNMIENSSDQKLITLCESILDYGCAAQDLFLGGHSEADEAKLAPLTEDANVPTEAVLTEANFPKIKADMSFFVLENAKVRLYFDTVKSKDNFSISDPNKIGTLGSGKVEANEDDLKYDYVEIEGIKPSDLGKTFVVTLNGVNYDYSALQCVYDIMNACEGSGFNAAKILFPSLVNYYLAANNYFGA